MVSGAARALSYVPVPVERLGQLLANFTRGRPCNVVQEASVRAKLLEVHRVILDLEDIDVELTGALVGHMEDPVYSEYRRELAQARDLLVHLREWRAEMVAVLRSQCGVRVE